MCGKNIEVDSMVNVAMTQPYCTLRWKGCYGAEEGRWAQILRARSSTDNDWVSLPLCLSVSLVITFPSSPSHSFHSFLFFSPLFSLSFWHSPYLSLSLSHFIASPLSLLLLPPPPIMVMQPLPVSSARVVAIPLVPFAKASNSKTPIGPFQITE